MEAHLQTDSLLLSCAALAGRRSSPRDGLLACGPLPSSPDGGRHRFAWPVPSPFSAGAPLVSGRLASPLLMSALRGNALRELEVLLSAITSQEEAVPYAICAALGSIASSGDPPAAVSRLPPLRSIFARSWFRSPFSLRGHGGASVSHASLPLCTLALGRYAAWLQRAAQPLPLLALAFRSRRHRSSWLRPSRGESF